MGSGACRVRLCGVTGPRGQGYAGSGVAGSGVCGVRGLWGRVCRVRLLGSGLRGQGSAGSGVYRVTGQQGQVQVISGELPHPPPAPRGGPSVTIDWAMGIFKFKLANTND